MRIDTLREGDAVLAATTSGALITDVVSRLSLARAEVEATFVTVTTASQQAITLTPEHHLPVGSSCCSELKRAKELSVGEQVWVVSPASPTAARPTTVVQIKAVISTGLFSPVLEGSTFPVVNDVVTSFDSWLGVAIHARLSPFMMPLAKATGTADLIRHAFFGAGRKYIDGLDTDPNPSSRATIAAMAAATTTAMAAPTTTARGRSSCSTA